MNALVMRDTRDGPGHLSALTTSRWVTAAGLFLLLIVVLAVMGQVISPAYGGNDYQMGAQHPGMTWRFLLGSDVTGRPILQYIISGARTTFGVGVLAAAIALVLGGLVEAGRRSSMAWLAAILGFVVDLGLMVPFLPLLLILGGFVTGGNAWALAGVFGLIGVPLAAILLGQPPSTHSSSPGPAFDLIGCVPITVPARAIRAFTLLAICFVSASATVDFLGFGVAASNPSWGNALTDVINYLGAGYWWWLLFPGLTLFLTLIALATVG